MRDRQELVLAKGCLMSEHHWRSTNMGPSFPGRKYMWEVTQSMKDLEYGSELEEQPMIRERRKLQIS